VGAAPGVVPVQVVMSRSGPGSTTFSYTIAVIAGVQYSTPWCANPTWMNRYVLSSLCTSVGNVGTRAGCDSTSRWVYLYANGQCTGTPSSSQHVPLQTCASIGSSLYENQVCMQLNEAPAGMFLTPSRSFDFCPNGTYSEQGATSCLGCPSVLVTPTQQSQCALSPQCSAGQYLSMGVCLQCTNGTYSTQGASSCLACPDVLVTPEQQTQCSAQSQCPVGQYKQSGQCFDCPQFPSTLLQVTQCGLNTGALIGIIVGSLVAVMVVLFVGHIIVKCYLHGRQRQAPTLRHSTSDIRLNLVE